MRARAGRLYLLLVGLFLAGGVTLRLADPFFVEALRLIAFDSYQRLSPGTYDPDLPVRVVDIDDESLQRIGQWPWPRTAMADLLTRLQQDGAAVVAFDVLFSEPDQTSPEEVVKRLPEALRPRLGDILAGSTPNDARFAAAIAAGRTVLASVLTNGAPGGVHAEKAGFAVAGDDPRPFIAAFPGLAANLPALEAGAAGVGAINWVPDRDQIVRRVPLVYRHGEEFVPTLFMEALRVAQGAGTYVLRASNASGQTAFGAATGLNAVRVGDVDVPTDADGGIWLRFRPSNPAAFIPAWKVLAGEADAAEIAGRIILVGTSAAGLVDLRATPLDPAAAGVEIHAQALEHILSGAALTRPDYALAVELALTVALGLLLGALLPRLSARRAALSGLVAIAVLPVAAFLAFDRAGLLFDPTWPMVTLGLLVAGATFYVYRRVEHQRGEMRRAFGHYVAPAVVDEIIADPQRLQLGGEIRRLTLMFCDVRNFTAISERLSATELTSFINELLSPLSEIILGERGTIDKYMGDAIMAFWNAPLDHPEHEAAACRAALAMITRMDGMNARWRAEAEAAGRPFAAVRIGIGINSGDCCVGNLGSAYRFDYSAIGDEVNVASRLEGLCKVYGLPVVVGEATVASHPALAALEIDRVRVKGRAEASRIFTLLDAFPGAAEMAAELTQRHAAILAAYRARDWEDAEAAIDKAQALGIEGLGGLYAVYRSRVSFLRSNPPPPDWDGTFTATAK